MLIRACLSQYLAFLHSLCITSLDLSPQNILVTEHAYGNIYELLDFSTCYRFNAGNSYDGADDEPLEFNWAEGSKSAPELQVVEDGEEEREEVNPFDVDVWALGKTLEAIDVRASPSDPGLSI